jgi:hypothetical protein
MSQKKNRRKHRAPTRQQAPNRYPIATLAYYGPDNLRATKVTVGIITKKGGEPEFLERWYSEDSDVRMDAGINGQIRAFLELHNPVRVVVTQSIIGCPHEEGIDYPEGQPCPHCPFWEGRDRWTGLMVN